jgi:DNA repair exonuclease SbcCD nuclease subunit
LYRFLHAADIHLDSPLVGLERYESAPVDAMRGATRRAFENLAALAIDERVAFVLLAGDLYDGDWKDYRTGLFFMQQMAKLREAAIPVYIVAGNHDAANRMTKSLHSPDNVHIFQTRRPETCIVPGLDAAIHGQGFASREVSEDLAAAFPSADPGLFNVGLLHTSLDGRPGHAPYAPTSTRVLSGKGYQYWALGHVHHREIISRDPWIVFSGNTQGRHVREVGPQGCTLVTVDNAEVTHVEAIPLDVLRWANCAVNIDGSAHPADMLDLVRHALLREAGAAGGLPVAARVEVTGSSPCHPDFSANPDHWVQEVRAVAASLAPAEVWIERVRFSTRRPVDLGILAERDDALGSLLRELSALSENPEEIRPFREALADLRAALPPEMLSGEDAFDPCAPETLARLREEARELLLARILREGTAP